jgi:hypothetical protein
VPFERVARARSQLGVPLIGTAHAVRDYLLEERRHSVHGVHLLQANYTRGAQPELPVRLVTAPTGYKLHDVHCYAKNIAMCDIVANILAFANFHAARDIEMRSRRRRTAAAIATSKHPVTRQALSSPDDQDVGKSRAKGVLDAAGQSVRGLHQHLEV